MKLYMAPFILASFEVSLALGNNCSLLKEHDKLVATIDTRKPLLGSKLNPGQLSGELDTYEEMRIVESSEDECNQKRTVHNLRIRIQKFSNTLISYIDEDVFDVRGFEKQGDIFASEISEIISLHAKIEPEDSELNSQISWARYMFERMGEAIEPLKYHECVLTAGHSLLWSSIDLDVRILRLFNTQGQPEVTADGFPIKVFLHQKELNRFKSSFNSLSLVPYGTRVMFEKRISHSADMLEFLSMGLTQGGT